jgi:ABC-type uncharacterized transport system ATPase subunit
VLEFMNSGRFPALERTGTGWTFDLPTDRDVQSSLSALAAARLDVVRFEHVKPSLHEIFVQQVGHAEVAERRPEVTRA